jgi:hypothetical protein
LPTELDQNRKNEGQEAAASPATTPAERALAEAAARRAKRDQGPPLPREINGRGGLEPTRYGDWEVRGVASDF